MKCLIIIDTDCDKIKLENLLDRYFVKYDYIELKIKLKIKKVKDLQEFFDILLNDLKNSKLYNTFECWINNHNFDAKNVLIALKENGCYFKDLGNYSFKIIKK